jgi:hypothetical protein
MTDKIKTLYFQIVRIFYNVKYSKTLVYPTVLIDLFISELAVEPDGHPTG